eukprot:TRINITY_DN219_c0_g1_i1.p1 TRINITY_DN219_c0_g1~~TRINITY_DN219_c0_g1_i1.p1  ORF type:complete len:1712 (+),score=344.09 TRINITY_DN219_c0_g1_i1:102-5237(+)
MATHYAQGTLIWIRHEEEVWVQAEIVTSTDKEIIVKAATHPDINTTDSQIKLGPNEPIFLRTSDVFTSEGLSVLDDLTRLTHLHEPAVLSSLQNRFDVDKIYTLTGPILISLNPFKRIPGLYTDEVAKSFLTSTEPKPHVFNTARMAYRGICDRLKSQTVLISGESGAGKTEATKLVMKFLADAGCSEEGGTGVEKAVLESNPLLEAFGNARTLRNDNSSRFGKFIELQFQNQKGEEPQNPGEKLRLCGARIHTYLLEKVRVCDQQEGERNYHVFYECCAAFNSLTSGTTYKFPSLLPKESCAVQDIDIDLEGFGDAGQFHFMTRSSCRVLKDVDDRSMFEQRINAMATIGVPAEDIVMVVKVMAAVLNLGNTKFDAKPGNSEASMVMKECESSFEAVCKLCGVDRKKLEESLCNTTRVTVGEVIKSPVNVRTAAENRDALAKAFHGMVFAYIVSKTNISIGYIENIKLFVGVLDIFGFECFKLNSFEQLCINFTNERLQQFFNQFVFKLEEQIYKREGVPWNALDFPDNQDAVDFLAAKGTGIFAILDEQCVVPGGSDQGFCNMIIKTHKGHRRFDEIKTKPSWFTIKHFAGPVAYCSDTFLDKNKDQLSTDIVECMGASTNDFITRIFKADVRFAEILSAEPGAKPAAKAPAGGKKKKLYTVSAEFKEQLNHLMDMVDTTEPHFIRCIKPNPQNLPDLYDRKGVTEQLRYGGVLQVVQVSRAGYPVRISHAECWDDYHIIADKKELAKIRGIDDGKVRVQKLLDHLAIQYNIPESNHGKSVAVGKNLVFFKQNAFERIKFARLELQIKSTTLIQADWRRKTRRHMYNCIRIFTCHLQSLLQSRLARIDFQQRRQDKAVRKLQALARGRKVRQHKRAVLTAIVLFQASQRGRMARKKVARIRKFVNARRIQRTWRGRRVRRVFLALRIAIYAAQVRYRMHAARQQKQKLKAEAKEVGALMAKTQKAQESANEMRKKVDELEAHNLMANSQNSALQAKIKVMEEKLHDYENKIEDLSKQAAEAAALANDTSKIVVDAGEQAKAQEALKEKDEALAQLQKELETLQVAYKEKEEALQGAEARYKQLLNTAAMQSMANLSTAGTAPIAPRPSLGGAVRPKLAANRTVDIQLVGLPGVGKTSLLETLITENDPMQLAKFNEQRANLMTHHQIQIGDKALKLLDCSGNTRAGHLVKEWFGRSQFVVVVYDMTSKTSLDHAVALVREVNEAGAKVVLFGNKWKLDEGMPMQVNLMEAKDAATRNDGMAMESSMLIDAVRLINNAIASEEQAEGADGAARQVGLDDGTRRSSISAAIDSVKSWFGGAADRQGVRSGNQGVLRPSLKGTKALKGPKREGDVNADLRPVQELQDSESAVTCICFGQEKLHKAYILLATASKDGTVVIYRCYRTEMEIAMLLDQEFPQDDTNIYNSPPADHSNIAVHSRLVGHSRAITSIFFNLLEDQLVTTSIDKSVRFWGVDTGEMLKVFTDSSPVPVAAFLPFNPQVFVAANSNAVLRLVNVANGMVLQKLKVETEVRALKFDDTGLFLLAGTKNGSIHVLEASDSSTLKFKFKVQLARGGVTCITFVAANYGQPPCLLVNTSDSSATIIDCTYGPAAGVLTNLTVRHRVRVAHSLLPLKCCYSPSGQGYLISGSEDKEVYIYSLAKGSNYKMQYLKHHQVPVVAVSVNSQDTLLASADSLGRIVLWRRMDFSHIPD